MRRRTTRSAVELTIEQAANLLGRSARQVRYLISTGKLPARKSGRQWRVSSEDLPRSPGQQAAADRRANKLEASIDQALEPTNTRRYSLTRIKAFAVGRPVLAEIHQTLGPNHPSGVHLQAALEQIAIGCHRYRSAEKGEAYRTARDLVSRAACALALTEAPEAQALLTRIEQELLPAVAGLIRRTERGRP